MMGAMTAVMLMATVGTHDTYLHSWGAIFIQDVVMPFRNKPFAPEQHLRVLRLSILGVCIFIFIFSMIFQQSEYIFLFFAITGAIFTGGSGAVIIGGLYWKRGTTAAAWSALLTGSVVAVGGIIIKQLDPDFFINGQEFWGLAMLSSSLVYIVGFLARRAARVRYGPHAAPGAVCHPGNHYCRRSTREGVADARHGKGVHAGRQDHLYRGLHLDVRLDGGVRDRHLHQPDFRGLR